MAKKKTALIGYKGKVKDGKHWRVLNTSTASGDVAPFKTIEDARAAGATKFTPMFTRG